jgi:hypothetical protein
LKWKWLLRAFVRDYETMRDLRDALTQSEVERAIQAIASRTGLGWHIDPSDREK